MNYPILAPKRRLQRTCAPRYRGLWALLGITFGSAAQAGSISVSYDGPPSASTCTLAQAIDAANAANGVVAAVAGSATVAGNCTGAASGSNTISIDNVASITLTAIDNYWYGPNALPPIASTIVIIGQSQATTISAVHTGDPTPGTANAFRLFYVSGGLDVQLPAGSLTLINVVVKGGYAKGGDSDLGGAGAGMGGAVFNQGSLTLMNVSLIGNTAQGGVAGIGNSNGGGGMGQDGDSGNAGGFGGAEFGYCGTVGDNGGGGGSGSGFGPGCMGSLGPSGSHGAGKGALGGAGGAGTAGVGGAGGDGGGGGGTNGGTYGGNGGGIGGGGGSGDGGGGGGVGGGGGAGVGGGGGGAFGGGGGAGGTGGSGGAGGFGGGAPASSGTDGGFGAGHWLGAATGGAGMGGAIFNHTGTVFLLNVTATGNGANGGPGSASCSAPCGGSGLGAVLFNLNGSVTIDFSTLAGNMLSGNNAQADNKGPEDGTVYSLAYGNKIQDGSVSSATLTIHSSIIHGTHADGGLQSDVSVNVVNGVNTNVSSLTYAGKNWIGQSYTVTGVTQSGTSPSTADPLLGALSIYSASPYLLPVLPIGLNSPANDAASSCLEADNSTTLTTDERGASRPYNTQCDVGAYEFDGDYIFANGADMRL